VNDDRQTTLLRDLRGLSALDERDARLHDELRALLIEQAQTSAEPVTAHLPRRPRRWPRLSVAAAVAGAAAVATLTVVAVYGGAGPASAQTVLRKAAAVRFAADQAIHLDYSVQLTRDGRNASGSGDVWVKTDAAGQPTDVAETFSLSKIASAPLQLVERDIETPAGVYIYHATDNAIEILHQRVSSLPTQSPTVPLPGFLFNGATVAQLLQQLSRGPTGGARLVGQTTIDGYSVDVVQVDNWPDGGTRTIFYFDANDHLLRGFDFSNTDPSHDNGSGRVRLTSTTQTSAATMPASTFQLNAPADASVQPPGVDGTVLARLCAANLKQLLLQGQTLLQACTAATPGLTEQALITALLGSTQADLDAAVAAGQITRDQAARALAAEQAQLHDFITQTAPKGPAGTPPVGK
jgi:hypothetical protein